MFYTLTRLMPTRLLRRLGLALDLLQSYSYDCSRYVRWSSTFHQDDLMRLDQRQLDALITKEYHVVEKGLSLKEPRPGFGLGRIEKLLRYLDVYVARFEASEIVAIALNVLDSYMDFNVQYSVTNEQVGRHITKLRQQIKDWSCATNRGGTFTVSREEILRDGRVDLGNFFASRHSIRQFSSDSVPTEAIEATVALAEHTPSVCNRQSWRVRVYSNPTQKQELLKYQNGNRGFGDQADKVLIVTADLRAFTSIGERHQCWIDGGMFAMSLVYALHSLGIGSCCLNWSVEKQADQGLRTAADIPDYEAVIMMLAIGYLPEQLRVTQSPRKALREVLICD